MEAGIEGGIHTINLLWEEHSQEEDWGFILIDARNESNKENRTAMLSTVQHEWPSVTQFTFNCYRHWAILVVREMGDRSGHFLHSKEGVTQLDPLAIIAYGIGVPPLIREIRGAHPHVTQTWYADDTGAGVNFSHILAHLWDLQARGPQRGYFPDPTKSILVVAPRNIARVEGFFIGMELKVVTRAGILESSSGRERRSKVAVWA